MTRHVSFRGVSSSASDAHQPSRRPGCSAMHHYLEAVKALGTKDPDKVMTKMREMPINDFMTKNGKLRIDGRALREMYLFEVKKPEESMGPWDYYKLVQAIPADQAFRPLGEGGCPWVKKD